MSAQLAEKKILVTGGTSNIGRAIALRAAEAGAHVAVSGRNKERGEAVVAEIRDAGGIAHFVAADLDGSPGAAQALVSQVIEVLGGPIEVLVNSAGIFPGSPTTGTDESSFDEVMAINVKAPYFLTAAVVPGMITRGEGVIINLGSWVARLGIPAGSAYAASKGAIETLTRAWAAEFGPSGIRVNAIAPGVIAEVDPDNAAADPRMAFVRGTPAGSIGHPDAIAHAAVYLASDEASYLHGSVIDVDGGRVAAAVLG